MSRIDLLILRRLSGRIGIAVMVVFGLICLVESLDAGRFFRLTELGGPQLALLTIAASAARWTIKTLSVTVLLGAIIGVIDLQARRELVVIKAAGFSIWRILRAPVIATLLIGLAVGVIGDTVVTMVNRTHNPTPTGGYGSLLPSSEVWLEQGSGDDSYVISALRLDPATATLGDVTVFVRYSLPGTRIIAAEAKLEDGTWYFSEAVQHTALEAPRRLPGDFTLPATSSAADLRLRYASTEDLTIFEIARTLSGRVSDPALRASLNTRLVKLLTLPLLLVGSLFIAFAFTAGYRRTNNYGAAVLYGIVLGFVVFVITEMADRAGSAGVLSPLFAAAGPAFVAIVIGLTVLLRKEDGRV